MEAPGKTALKERLPRRTGTPQLWAPSDLRTHPNREKRLLQRMESCVMKLGNSQFYHNFQNQLQTATISEHLHKALGSYSKMQMVIYGISSFEGTFKSSKNSRLQLSLAILMQRDFKWIGYIQVFDPILSATERRILEALGCSVLYFNEDGMRKALEPTLFFVPRCQVHLYTNLLQVNWYSDLLSKVVIFGNSFDLYKKYVNPNLLWPIWAANKFTNEFTVTINHPHISFLKPLSWISFNLEQQFMNGLPFNNDGFCGIVREIDLQTDPCREQTFMQEMERCINNFESSQLYNYFQYVLQNPPISEYFHMVRGSELKMKIIIIYDNIGSIEFNKDSRLHLSLAILMKKHFKWIGDIQVFHPFISATECRVLKTLGCIILSLDEYRRSWQAIKPTIFFLLVDDCTKLYSHLLKVNWKSSLLRNSVICGTSLREGSCADLEYTMRYKLAARNFVKLFRIKTFSSGDYDKAFHQAFRYLTWHFFGLVPEAELQFMNKFLEKGCYISLLE